MVEGNEITKQGLEDLKKELEEAKTIKREEIAAKLKEAISYGDLSENSEYDAAKDAQAELEAKIDELEEKIRTAKVITHTEDNNLGCIIAVEYKGKDGKKKKKELKLVGNAEENPFENKISNESPVGKALLFAKEGKTVDVELEDKTVKYKVTKITAD